LCVGMCVHIDLLYHKSALSYCKRALSHERTLSLLFMRQLGRVCFACVAVCCRVFAVCLQCFYSGFAVRLQWVAVGCSVLQCVCSLFAVCCSVLQCDAVCYSVLQYATVCYSVLQRGAVCYSVLRCLAVRCNVLQYAALQYVWCV